ncbi:DUF3024 domain-containing protein [Amycolatopsis nigrescens]|uniref:DUF3024 domain-containing protein n=1 Tax=Amycolatopsis nigrescens TaxID=381445 RepID=UPI0004758135|nr:DUF3024 domain-containing protein [Amycolatopsis nigrescens]
MSSIPEFQQRQIERWCAGRVPARLRDEIRVECRRRGGSVTILERRAQWSGDVGSEWIEQRVAQLRYDANGRWSVYWADRNGRWLSHPGFPEADTPVPLLAEIDRNPDGVFWG